MVQAGDIEGLAATFAEYSTIEVADYQRNFDWTKSEISDLWRDLQAICGAGNESKVHFFGSLIVQQTGASSCELVDGQQRMTTVFLIAARLRDEINLLSIREIPSDEAGTRPLPVASEIEDFLYGKMNQATQPRYIPNTLLRGVGTSALKPASEKDREKSIPRRSRDTDKEATLAFRNAYWFIKSLVQAELDGLDEHSALQKIYDLSSALFGRMRVLTITTVNSEESLDVFMTTNDRGLPLGVFDLARGQVLKALTSGKNDLQQKEVFVETLRDWEEILTNVEGSKPDQFLRHHLLSSHKKKMTMKGVPTFTADLIDFGSAHSAKRAQELWESVKVSSGVYDSILRPTIPSPAKENLESLRLVADSYRVLALRILHPEADLRSDHQIELIRLLWVAVFRWNMAFGNAQDLETALQGICEPLWQKGGYGSAKLQLEELAETECNVDRYLADPITMNTARAILLALETRLSGKAAPISLSSFHVEHIAPQKPTPQWEEALDLQGKEYKERVGDVGNLTIFDAGLNQSVKQKPFIEKKIEYKQSRSNMTNDLVKFSGWGQTEIDNRRAWIVASLENVLRVDPKPIVDFSSFK